MRLELMRLPDPPTAIFSCNNLMTLGLMGALVELKIACPDQVSVLGFDDFDWAASFNPRLTTMSQQMYQMGRSVTEMLIQRIECPMAEAECEQGRALVLEAELRVRDSKAPAPLDFICRVATRYCSGLGRRHGVETRP
jgi:LacI family transcriptional regulator